VLHARLADQRAWRTLWNAYGFRLFYAWHSFLGTRSPIAEEARTLDVFAGDSRSRLLGEEAGSFFDMRRRYCAQVRPAEGGVFWGSQPDDHLTPNSIFGQGLHGPATFAAVASAMERARQQTFARAEPERRVFELDAITRSYYDPMILSAVLRWLEPQEAWWGWRVEEARGIVAQMLVRLAEDRDLVILTSELLLAAQQGKLPPPAIGEARAVAESLVASVGPDERAPLQLGLAMAPEYSTEDQLRARARWQERLDALKVQREQDAAGDDS
jgi:hypothetical protein